MNITSILRLQTLVVFIGLGFISSEIAASKTADKSVYIAPKLSQGSDFEAFTLIASQGHGRSGDAIAACGSIQRNASNTICDLVGHGAQVFHTRLQ